MRQKTEKISAGLAGILADYLANISADSPFTGRTITAATNMVTELQLDSFQVMEFMLEVEDHFDVVIDLESLANVQTIEDLAILVSAAQNDA